MTFYSFMSIASFCHLAYGFVERKILLSNPNSDRPEKWAGLFYQHLEKPCVFISSDDLTHSGKFHIDPTR